MTADDVIRLAGPAAGWVTVGIGAVIAWINIGPNKITAKTAERQFQAEEDRKMRAELRERADKLEKECEDLRAKHEARSLAHIAEIQHWKDEANSKEKELTLLEAWVIRWAVPIPGAPPPPQMQEVSPFLLPAVAVEPPPKITD